MSNKKLNKKLALKMIVTVSLTIDRFYCYAHLLSVIFQNVCANCNKYMLDLFASFIEIV